THHHTINSTRRLTPEAYVATLPAACTDGQLAFVADARTPTQGVGKGTGVVARCSSNTWKSLADGSAVQK
ncbi:hypothetical protein, partial [Acetobacter sp.]|uniref:hypothetical protein n=1 Tax=Acetobacter sp. TaxID=440 RepID=UPI0039EC6ADC